LKGGKDFALLALKKLLLIKVILTAISWNA